MAKKLTDQEIQHMANLAKLKFEGSEIDEIKKQLEFALTIVDQLNEVDVTGVQPTFLITENLNNFREDQVDDWQQKDGLLKNAPETANDLIKVPSILSEDDN